MLPAADAPVFWFTRQAGSTLDARLNNVRGFLLADSDGHYNRFMIHSTCTCVSLMDAPETLLRRMQLTFFATAFTGPYDIVQEVVRGEYTRRIRTVPAETASSSFFTVDPDENRPLFFSVSRCALESVVYADTWEVATGKLRLILV